jgi:hypothetical protein
MGFAAEEGGQQKKQKPKSFQESIREFEAQAQRENPELLAEARAKAASERDIEEKANAGAIKTMIATPPTDNEALDDIQRELKQGQWQRCQDGSAAACDAHAGKLFGNPAAPIDEGEGEGEGVRPPEPRL